LRPDEQKKSSNDFYKYSAMSIKMGAVIAGGFVGGHYLDKYMQFQKIPVFTLLFGFIGLGLSIYIVMVDTKKK
jgi:F0F1-type ATP synthase assembly protein I